jgi:hypothetical protein
MSSPQVPARHPKLLSVNEKLALNGKGFKIVAKKHRKSIASPVSTPIIPTVSTPSIVIPRTVVNSAPLISPEGGEAWASVKHAPTVVKKDSLEEAKIGNMYRGPKAIRKGFPEEDTK